MKKKKTESREPASFQQRVAGTVKNGGELLKFARVALWLPPRKFNAINSHTMRGRTTAGDGKVIASTIVRDGKFSLDVPFQDENWHLLVETPARIVALEGPLKIQQGKTKQLELSTQASGKVRGQVSHISDAKGPLWAVLFSRTGLQYETRVGTDGRFEFQNVYPGNYGLKAACESVRDSEIPALPNPTDDEFTIEKSYEVHEVPSRPFRRATRITVNAGQTTEGVLIRFQP